MKISRNFIVIGSLYLIVGIGFGMYMGGSGDHTLAPLHAHINLLGFTLMTVFGLIYRVIPVMGPCCTNRGLSAVPLSPDGLIPRPQ